MEVSPPTRPLRSRLARTTADRAGLPSRSEQTKEWAPDPVEHVLSGHTDWVRDVAWAPSVGVGKAYLASAGQDKAVLVWTQPDARSAWTRSQLDPSGTPAALPQQQQGQQGQQQQQPVEGKFGDVVWRVSWSVAGNVLAVSSGASPAFFPPCCGLGRVHQADDLEHCAGDGKVSLWKENLKGVFENVSELTS